MTGDLLTLAPADALAARLKGLFIDRGYAPVEPPMLLPADMVLDRLGEDLRRRLLLVTAPDGREMCLRPDFTLPLARQHLQTAGAAVGRYSYAGLAFRFPSEQERTRRSAEFRQAGIEHFGGDDAEAVDAEVLAATMAGLTAVGFSGADLILGDVALFETYLDALDLGDGWRRRLGRDFRRHEFARDMVHRLGGAEDPGPDSSEQTAFAAALAAMDPEAARAVVQEVMAIAGATQVGGRSATEIAARFVEKARFAREGRLDQDVFARLDAYLSIAGAPGEALQELKALAPAGASAYAAALDALERRLARVDAAGVDLSGARFVADFAGRIQIYTGMVFEVRARADSGLGTIASGGRYDGFLKDLGADEPGGAVGGSIYVDRLLVALEPGP